MTSLVRVAVETDAPARLILAAEKVLRQPLGLAGPSGESLGRAPDTETGERALAIARAAATNRLVAPPGWRILSIHRSSSRFGFLAIGEIDGEGHNNRQLVELLSALLADQLQRAMLLRARTTEMLRRIICDSDVGPARARREAAGCGLELADMYWAAILGWRGRAPRPEVAEAIDGEAREEPSGALSVLLGERIALLHPGQGADGSARALEWFRKVAGRARRLAPIARPQVIVGERALALADLSGGVAELDALWRMGPRREDDQPLVSVRHYALDRLLARVAETDEAREFVRRQIGPLLAWDGEHQGGLLTVLEAGLDYPRHDVAAARCFMHRNTFRHRLRHATEVLGDTLEDPEARLAVHVALKLRRLSLVQ
ncbi:PucR family transcriptional regulator [Candidatus Solirubrobacter pratensis]|uniref:PucR family transcriptional regulator n=1 Tax=Candidatus Solirubrobacter pratensis TaxID=1298857 RepID=UPI0018CBE08A|nr:helix-turn-helix domain-containing protein [Candidatus Solirubrobacter pratensis]